MKKILTLPIMLLFSIPCFAQEADNPKILIEKKYDQIKEIVKSTKEKKEMQDRIKKIMDTFVDYKKLSHQALIKYWDNLKESEQKEYTEAFKGLIQRTYVKRFDPQKEFSIEFQGECEFREGRARVASTIKSGKSEANVNYLFYKPDEKTWWAYDVVIDDVSMMKNYRKEFHKVFSTEGFRALIAKIKKKATKE